MINPYWMVFVNSIFFSVLILSIFIFRFIYPKKEINYFYLLILISILPLISIFRFGVYESGDLSIHIMESILFFELLNQGEILPLWAGAMNSTYGYPAFHFTYPLPFYIISFFHILGFTFINSTKLLLAFSFTLSGIFMYFWLRKEVREAAAFTGAIFYLFAPYHLIDLHFRADVGEILSFVFLPLCLLAARNFLRTASIRWFLIEAFSFAFLLLSHPAIALIGYVVTISYILFFIYYNDQVDRKKLIINQTMCVFLSLILTVFYWLPILYNLRYTLTQNFVSSVSFVELRELIYSPWHFGLLFQGPTGQLSYLVGYPQLLTIVISIIFITKKKITGKNKSMLIMSLFIVFFSVFLMLEVSSPVWQNVPFLKSFQFSYRFLGITIFTTSIIAAITVNVIKRQWIVVSIILFAIIITILNWGNRKNVPHITDEILRSQIPFTATNGSGLAQAATIWSDPINPWAKEIPKNHIEILKGKGEIRELRRKNSSHEYLINTENELILKENTLFFPGWTVKRNNKQEDIKILSSSYPKGVISFTIPKGIHKVEIIFKDTKIIEFSKLLSTIAFIIIIILSIFKRKIEADDTKA